ncbi:hypothetical protein MACH10_11540 [Thalassospira tepidiphila]|uniref:hypothetical protein n=1 Tax=Thalassospira tepidiphila TaxID=393657 RepID=UPI002921F378|nr:hypothetical protein MACH10_11540 [Thalassospira tepidiphila]
MSRYFWVFSSFVLLFVLFFGDGIVKSIYLNYLCSFDNFRFHADDISYDPPETLVLRGERNGCGRDCKAALQHGVISVYLYNNQNNIWEMYGYKGEKIISQDLDLSGSYEDDLSFLLRNWSETRVVSTDVSGVFDYEVGSFVVTEEDTGVVLSYYNHYHMRSAGWFFGLLSKSKSGAVGSNSCEGRKPYRILRELRRK